MGKFFVLLVSLAFGAARLALPSHGVSADDVFKDFAHIWVGILIGVAVALGRKSKFYWFLVFALTCLELAAALLKR